MTGLHTITIRMVMLSQSSLNDVTQGLERFTRTNSVLYHVHFNFLGNMNICSATILQQLAFLLQQLERVLIDLRLKRVSYAFVNCLEPLRKFSDSKYGSRSQDDMFSRLREYGVEVNRQLDRTI